jgi:hypothetical protein
MIVFELKAKNDVNDLHIFQNLSDDILIHLIKNDPDSLISIIKNMKRTLEVGGQFRETEIVVTDMNVYI